MGEMTISYNAPSMLRQERAYVFDGSDSLDCGRFKTITAGYPDEVNDAKIQINNGA